MFAVGALSSGNERIETQEEQHVESEETQHADDDDDDRLQRIKQQQCFN